MHVRAFFAIVWAYARQAPFDLFWGVGYFVSATVSATSTFYEAGLLGPFNALRVLVPIIIDYASAVAVAIMLAVHLYPPPLAPEALGVTDAQWQLLRANESIEHLREYADWGPARIPVASFLPAARILTVASTLSYAEEGEIRNDVLAKYRLNWNATMARGDNGRAQALLLMNENKHGDRPVIILAFRGTELPDEAKEGWREFYPDWLRNLHICRDDVPEAGSVARGFYNAWSLPGQDGQDSMKNMVERTIREFSQNCSGKTFDLYVTGHSAGGALAGVSLMDLLSMQQCDGHFQLAGLHHARAASVLRRQVFADGAGQDERERDAPGLAC